MRRSIEREFATWRVDPERKPIILSGARQVGKSYLVSKLVSPAFSDFVEINFELKPTYKTCFQPDLVPEEILRRLEVLSNKRITPGKTLVFFDEAQLCPECLASLRYFYEQMPQLHIIAAGSLIEFAVESISVPVGRVTFRFLTPLSFEEYLENSGNERLLEELGRADFKRPFDKTLHVRASQLLREHLAIGGMPQVVQSFVDSRDYLKVEQLQIDLLDTYERDFPKYARRSSEYRYVQTVFSQAPRLVGQQFKFTQISRDIKSQYLRAGIELLHKARVLHPIYSSAGPPARTNSRLNRYKLLFLDVGLMQRASGSGIKRWLTDDAETMANSGAVAEQFVGQQILAHRAFRYEKLYYWERLKRGSSAEVDYLLDRDDTTIPIEVKAGALGSLKSLWLYLSQAPQTPFGLRVSSNNLERVDKLLSLPAYAFGSWLRKNR